jgi:hypothetical protein
MTHLSQYESRRYSVESSLLSYQRTHPTSRLREPASSAAQGLQARRHPCPVSNCDLMVLRREKNASEFRHVLA